MNIYQDLIFFISILYFFSCALGQYVGNPDDTAKIERPCPTYDLNCIRAFFENHAHCKKMFGPVPDPFNRPQANLYIPRINASFSIVDLKVTGLNGRVEEFYINRETDNLVIAVEFRDFTQSSRITNIIFHRRAKEPVVTVGFANLTYSSQVMTAVIPKIDDLQLQDAEVTIYSNDPTGRFIIGPSALESTDPQPLASITAVFTDVPTAAQELALVNAAFFMSAFIQYNICDFGIIIT